MSGRVTASILSALALLTALAPAAPAAARPGLDWTPCPGQGVPAGMVCSAVQVPADWSVPAGRRITLALARLPVVRGGQRAGTLLVNPGGPGAGIATLRANAANFAALRERFDAVMWEPRGSGASWGERGGARYRDCVATGTSPAFPADQAEFAALARRNQALYQRCRQHDPAVFDHLSSSDHARDLDAVARALGDTGPRTVNYLGNSYGGMIGGAYARMFPDRVRTMVLDSGGAGTTSAEEDDRAYYRAVEDLFARFASWCAGERDCRLHGQDVSRRWRDLVASADAKPIPTRGGQALTGLDLELQGTKFANHQDRWAQFASAIDQARRGDATGFGARPAGGPAPFPNAGLATQCADGLGLADYQRFQASVARGKRLSRHFPRNRAAYGAGCAGWPRPAGTGQRLPADRLPPLLGGASTMETDQVRHALVQVPGSRLVRVDGTFHGLILNFGNRCMAGHTLRYLVDRALPPKADTTCPA